MGIPSLVLTVLPAQTVTSGIGAFTGRAMDEESAKTEPVIPVGASAAERDAAIAAWNAPQISWPMILLIAVGVYLLWDA